MNIHLPHFRQPSLTKTHVPPPFQWKFNYYRDWVLWLTVCHGGLQGLLLDIISTPVGNSEARFTIYVRNFTCCVSYTIHNKRPVCVWFYVAYCITDATGGITHYFKPSLKVYLTATAHKLEPFFYHALFRSCSGSRAVANRQILS